MQPALRIRLPVIALSAFLGATTAPKVGAEGPAPTSSGPQPGVENNFGFPLAFAPSRNLQGFYDAFGVRSGDAMWIDPAKRVDIW
jgi:hypothetical protein